MRRLFVVFLSLAACSPRRETKTTSHPVLQPPQPPPPGQVTVYGPLRVESVTPVRSEAGWDRDFVHGSRLVTYDIVLAQERAACPKEIAEKAFATDEEGCKGLATIPDGCKTEPTLRARAEVAVGWSIDVAARCAGDAAAFPTEGDPKNALSNGARACFRARNKLKPESSWTSLYELTELRFAEKMESASTSTPRLLARLLAGGAARHCRDDGAYLDGSAGRASPTLETAPVDLLALGATLVTRAPLGGVNDAASIPLTADWKSEHSLWEQCNQKPARDHVVASERCLMLRQLDRFLRDVEDLARTETPKGTGP
ncbi:MAG: hypothetical protein ACXWUG_17675 [Polyangiales bacterium]